VALLIELLRPDDLLALTIEARNLRLDTSNPRTPKLVLDKPNKAAYLIVRFAPQHILEKAYFEVGNVKNQPPGQTQLPPPPATTDPLDAPGSVPSRMAGGSDLVFKLPPNLTSIPYTTQALLDWKKFDLVVSPAAQGKKVPPPVKPPTDQETAIELPYGLVISPDANAGWVHSMVPEVFKGRVALWHTRLARWKETVTKTGKVRFLEEASEQNQIPFRAIWCENFVDHGVIPPLGTESPFRAAMSPHDRPQIVILTTGTTGYFIPNPNDGSSPFTPTPAKASRMFLSTLGGWLTSRGSWPNLPTYTATDGSLQSLDLTEWVHVATQGRDHYVRIVYEGYLYPFGHRASLIKVTERKVVPTGTDPVVNMTTAYLRQHMYIVVREREKTYGSEPYKFSKREMPFWQSVRINTKVTPDIDLPQMLSGDGNPHDSFWINVGGQGFDFHVTATDLSGKHIDFLAKLIFMANSEPFPLFLQQVYAGSGNQRLCFVQGQKVAYVDPAAGDVTLKTNGLFFDTQFLHTQQPFPVVPFIPTLDHSAVSVTALEHILGVTTPVDIGWYNGYLTKGLDSNAGVFAELIGPQPKVEFTADKAGGLATPKMSLTALSARKGLVAGNADDAAAGNIKPSQFFGDITAELFGTIPIQQLIPVQGLIARADLNAPEIRTLLQPNSQAPDTIVTKLEWSPQLAPYNNPPVTLDFNAGGQSALTLKVRLARSLKGDPPTSDATGELSHFMITLADVIGVQIDSLKFSSKNGAKSTVEAKLPSSSPVKFIGPLSFVQTLADILPPGIFGGSGVQIQLKPDFIRATLTIGLPTIACGVFSLEHISFMAGLDLPYLDGKPGFEFAFASRSAPFLLTVEIFGGGGFVHLLLNTDGVQMVEGSLEFGGNFCFDIGVASGGVHVMAGIYFQMRNTGSTITGFVDIGGELSVLGGIISVSIDLNLSLSYDTGTHKVTGKATLSISVHIIFFSVSVSVSVEKSFGTSGGDPRVKDLMSAGNWANYAAAFA
jgi:hypothetical protein